MDDRSNFRSSPPEEPVRPIARVPHDLPEPHRPAGEEKPAKAPRLRKPSLSSNNRRKPLIIAGIVLLIIAIGAGAFYLGRQQPSQTPPKSASGPSAHQQQQQLIAEVSKLTPLPTGETPTIATVNDASQLKNQSFFANAKNGDKVLIYNKAGKAYLYRPSTNQLIIIAPISGNTSPDGTSAN